MSQCRSRWTTLSDRMQLGRSQEVSAGKPQLRSLDGVVGGGLTSVRHRRIRAAPRQRRSTVKLSAPKQWTFYIAAILWIIALIGAFWAPLQAVAFLNATWAYWIAMLSGLVLVLGVMIDGL